MKETTELVIFSTISSYRGNTSKSIDCINHLYLTPLEVRWLNIFINVVMEEEKKLVEWPIVVHIGLYHPKFFEQWLERKKMMEERRVMSLKDQARKLIQGRINIHISP